MWITIYLISAEVIWQMERHLIMRLAFELTELYVDWYYNKDEAVLADIVYRTGLDQMENRHLQCRLCILSSAVWLPNKAG